MAAIRYRIIEQLPDEVQTPEFTTLADGQVRLRVMVRDGELVIVGTGAKAADIEALLLKLGIEELGVDLCG